MALFIPMEPLKDFISCQDALSHALIDINVHFQKNKHDLSAVKIENVFRKKNSAYFMRSYEKDMRRQVICRF